MSSIRFSNVDKISNEDEEPVRLCNYVDVYYNDFITEALDFMVATATTTEIRAFQLRKGDVLITKDSESWDDIAVPAYVAEPFGDVLCGYHLAQIRPDERHLDGRFLFRAFKADGLADQFKVAANGITRFGLGKYWIDNAQFPVPPLDEQRAIAAFLDRETARIDGLIAKKARQIELLQEKRAALISHAVTKGLDPKAPMKPSGIECLGDVPAHWEVKRLRQCIRFITSGPRGWAEFYSDDGDLFIRITNLTRKSIELDLSDVQRVTPPHGAEADRTQVGPGDILISITADLGSVAVVPPSITQAYISQHICLLRPLTENHNPKWIGYAVFGDSCKAQLLSLGYGGTKVQLGLEDIKDLRVCVPSLAEQREILKVLDFDVARHDSLIMMVRKSITILQEYRTALISSAVTGKIDVR